MTSHLGQNPTDHVVLEMVLGVTGGFGTHRVEFVRTGPNGDQIPSPSPGGFRVPRDTMLVITDVDWQYANGGPGSMQTFRLDPLSGPRAGYGARVFESAVVLGPQGSGGASIAMTSGFAISPGARIGADATPGPFAPGAVQHCLLRGYLTPNVRYWLPRSVIDVLKRFTP